MIHFNELYITEDGKHLIVDAEMDNDPMYKNCYISRVTVDVGENCTEGGESSNAIAFDAPTNAIVGDLDEDGILSKKELEVWSNLHSLVNARPTSEGIKLRHDEDRGWWFRKQLPDEDGNPIDVFVDQSFVDLAESIRTKYTDMIYNYEPGSSENLTAGQVLSYIHDIFGVFSVTAQESSIPGDLNGDGEVNVNDFNQFIDYLIDCYNKTADYIVVGSRTKRFRKCYDVNDLVPLVELKSDLSPKIFIVTVHAECYGDVTEIANAGCGYDVNKITGIAYNGKPIYCNAVRLASAVGDRCDTSTLDPFIDYILKYYAFDFALRCGDICAAVGYLNDYLTNSSFPGSVSSGNCGCHGTY